MQKTTLVIMAAGIGSRFGGGIKQLAPVGPNGEIIMDYSIHDALEAGFNKIVFIIRKDLEKDFKEVIGDRISKICDVDYAFQEKENLPEGFTCPADRKKPWGTGHAVLSCKGIVNEPFAVINADDYYGKAAFKNIHDYLVANADSNYKYCMAGFIIRNTLSDNGGVTRGVCKVDENNMLLDVVETADICKHGNDAIANGVVIDGNSHVSMNMWGLTPEFFDELESRFVDFLKGVKPEDIKAEYLLPGVIGDLLADNKATVEVIETPDKWFGVTYAEDKQSVVDSFAELIKNGVYTSPL